jgi:hypothetical protein
MDLRSNEVSQHPSPDSASTGAHTHGHAYYTRAHAPRSELANAPLYCVDPLTCVDPVHTLCLIFATHSCLALRHFMPPPGFPTDMTVAHHAICDEPASRAASSAAASKAFSGLEAGFVSVCTGTVSCGAPRATLSRWYGLLIWRR